MKLVTDTTDLCDGIICANDYGCFGGFCYDIMDLDSTISSVTETENDLTLYPSPTKDALYIRIPGLESGAVTIQLVDLEGSGIFYEYSIFDQAYRLETGSLFPGYYIIKIQGAKTWTGRIVVQ